MADVRADLRPEEWAELYDLMRRGRYVRLDPLGERRLRELLSVRNPLAATMEWYDLVKFGLVAVGVHYARQRYGAASQVQRA
jgi:hypothetical protein